MSRALPSSSSQPSPTILPRARAHTLHAHCSTTPLHVQVRCKPASLDSARCFVAQQPGMVSAWQGRDSTHREQRAALSAGRALAERLAEQPPPPLLPLAAAELLPLAAAEPTAATTAAADDTATNGTSLGHQRRLSLSAHAQAQAPVLLSGTTPHSMHLDKLGLFTATGEQHNGKPSFANERHAGLLLWWAEGKWWVGKREELGHGRGWIKAQSEAARPDTPGAGHAWLIYSKEARRWVAAQLACTTAHTVLLQSSSSPPPSSSSAAAGEGQGVQLQEEKLGAYLESGEVNGKPCFSHHYYHNLLLWWAGGRWWVGKREELGQGRGWIKAKSEAARPDTPGAGHAWLIYSKEARRWVAAELACIDGGSLLALTATASALTAAATMPAAAPRPPPVALRWDVRVVREGSEPDDFWQALGGLSRRARAVSQPTDQDQDASSPLDAPLAVPLPPRLYLWPHAPPRPDAPVAAGAAAASELVESEVFSFSQASLEQDATFLLDTGSAVFAWVGAAAPLPAYGPAWLGQAAAAYVRARAAVDGRDARGVVYTVHAGEEPPVFTSLFGAWSDEAAGRKESPHEAARRLLLGAPSAVAAAAVAAATGARSSTQTPRASMDRSSHSNAVTRGGSVPAPANEPSPPAALRHLSSESPPRQSPPRSPPRCAGRLDHTEGHTAGPTTPSAEDGHALERAAAGEVVLQLAAGGAYPAAAGPSTPPTPLRVTGQASLPRRGSAERALPRSAGSARRRAADAEAAGRGSAGSVEGAAAALPAGVLSPGCVLSRGGSTAAATAPIPDASSPPKHPPAHSPSTTPSKTPTLNLSTLQLDARSSTAARSAEGEALDSARRRAGAASTAAARLGGSDGAAYADPETARFGYREIRYEWRAHGVNPTCKELYLHDDEFARLFGMGKAAFYAQRQWQQRDAKQKLHLF